MGDQTSERRSAAAWKLARCQHGVVARGQLLDLGYTPKAIKHRLRVGRLHPIVRGVYSVGRPQLSREGRWMAAILACGPDAALSHRSAAALWGFGEEHHAYIDITVRRASEARIRGIRCHRRPTLPVPDLTNRLGIPLTTPVQTFLDRRHTASGLTPLRFSHHQVKHEPRHVEDILARTVANLRGHPAPLLAG